MSKICLQCGCSNVDDANFCVQCGGRLSSAGTGEEKTASESFGAPEERNEEERKGTESAKVFSANQASENDAEEGKIRAEWQGSDCRCYGAGTQGRPAPLSGGYPSAPRPYGGASFPAPAGGELRPYPPEYYEEQRRQWTEKVKKERAAGKRKTLFVLAFVGLLLDFIYGIGFLMCLPVAIIASVDSRKLYKEEKRTSTQLVWAMIVGYIGAVAGLVFFILMA